MNNNEIKNGFFTIGYIENRFSFLSELAKLAGVASIDTKELNKTVDTIWSDRYNKVICFDSNLNKTDPHGNDISFILIDTGLTTHTDDKPIYGGFRSNFTNTSLGDGERKWTGIVIGTSDQILSVWGFAKPTALDDFTYIPSYSALSAYLSGILSREVSVSECKEILDTDYITAVDNSDIYNFKDEFAYFALPGISDDTHSYYAYMKPNTNPKKHVKWFGLYIITEKELVNMILDNSYYHIGDLTFSNKAEGDKFIEALADKAMPEKWDYSMPTDTSCPILKSYIEMTYYHLQDEDEIVADESLKKIIKLEGKIYFNTGLLDRYFNQIFIVGDIDHIALDFYAKKMPVKKEIIRNPRIHSENDVPITSMFSKQQLPKIATYFKNCNDVVFDASLEIHLNDAHIFIDGIARKRLPKYIPALQACGDDPEKIKTLAAKAAGDFKAACERAKLLAERNYKLAVPQYWKETGEIQFLLPIYLENEETDKPQCALVLSLDTSGRNVFYRGETILTLDMAYNNARLIAKPDIFWLNSIT